MKIPTVAEDFAELASILGLEERDPELLLHIERAFYAGYLTGLKRIQQACALPERQAERALNALERELYEFGDKTVRECEGGG